MSFQHNILISNIPRPLPQVLPAETDAATAGAAPTVQVVVNAVGGEHWESVSKEGMALYPLGLPPFSVKSTVQWTWNWGLYGIAFTGPDGETVEELKKKYLAAAAAVKEAAVKEAAAMKAVAHVVGVPPPAGNTRTPRIGAGQNPSKQH